MNNSVNGGLFHDGQELSFTDLAVAILVELIDHSLQLVVIEVLLHLTSHTSQVPEADFASVVLVEKLEGFGDLLDRVALTDLGGHDLEEVWVLDLARTLAVEFSHEIEHLLLLDVESEGPHANLELVVINSTSLISVEQLKGFFDFLLLLIGEFLSSASFDTELHALLLAQKFRFLEHL